MAWVTIVGEFTLVKTPITTRVILTGREVHVGKLVVHSPCMTPRSRSWMVHSRGARGEGGEKRWSRKRWPQRCGACGSQKTRGAGAGWHCSGEGRPDTTRP